MFLISRRRLFFFFCKTKLSIVSYVRLSDFYVSNFLISCTPIEINKGFTV